MPKKPLFDISQERLKKALSRKDPAIAKQAFLEKLTHSSFSKEERTKILKAVNLLENGPYIKEKKGYTAHPIRVAMYVLNYDRETKVDAVILALLHNIFEVIEIEPGELIRGFGQWVYEGCLTFNVDRSRQKSDGVYLQQFYSSLKSDPRWLLIKIFDKWDNTLSLYFNPSLETRKAYLDEIEQYLIPIIPESEQALQEIFIQLAKETRNAAPIRLEDYLVQHAGSATTLKNKG